MSDLAADRNLAPGQPLSDDATLIEQWSAVEDAARVVAMLAGRETPFDDPQAQARIALVARIEPARSGSTRAALGELVATMRAGLDALLGAHGTSAKPRPAAERLWQEYERGRAAVLTEAAMAIAS